MTTHRLDLGEAEEGMVNTLMHCDADTPKVAKVYIAVYQNISLWKHN